MISGIIDSLIVSISIEILDFPIVVQSTSFINSNPSNPPSIPIKNRQQLEPYTNIIKCKLTTIYKTHINQSQH